MRARFTAIRKGIQSIINSKKYATKSGSYCEPHMNELPVPCQPWEPWYSRQQRFYRKHLNLGLAWWLFSLGMAIHSDALLLGYWGPPCAPAPPEYDE